MTDVARREQRKDASKRTYKRYHVRDNEKLGVVAYTVDPSTQEEEACEWPS